MRADGFRQWLALRHYRATGRPAPPAALDEALAVLEAEAIFQGEPERVWLRTAACDNSIYLDLGDTEWHAVHVYPGGWEVVACPPVHFRRPAGLGALPWPVRGGRLDALWPLVNVPGEAERALVAGFLVAALRPRGPYPLLLLTGEQGTAKSTTARLLRTLVDPAAGALRAEPRSTQDLMVCAENNWVVTADNLSEVPIWLSNALCRLATGGAFSVRKLYTNDAEAVLEAQRPVILTSIDDVVTRGDLLDRTLLVSLAPIPPACRRDEAALAAAFTAAAPGIFGALLDALAGGLARLPRVHLPEPPRMADAARWATACETALGRPFGSFLAAYVAQQRDAGGSLLERSPLVVPLIRFLRHRPDGWEGTASELFLGLAQQQGLSGALPRDWPGNAAALSGALRQLAPSLRQYGIEVTLGQRSGKTGRRILRLAAVAGAGPVAPPVLRPEAPPSRHAAPAAALPAPAPDAPPPVAAPASPPAPAARLPADPPPAPAANPPPAATPSLEDALDALLVQAADVVLGPGWENDDRVSGRAALPAMVAAAGHPATPPAARDLVTQLATLLARDDVAPAIPLSHGLIAQLQQVVQTLDGQAPARPAGPARARCPSCGRPGCSGLPWECAGAPRPLVVAG